MILSKEEKAANRAAFLSMNAAQKAEYILAYYKLPLFLGLVALIVVGSVVHRTLTYKEPVLYLGFVNVVPPEQLEEQLSSGYLAHIGADERSTEVLAYQDLYVSDAANTPDHQYAYASKLKLMAAADAEQLDLVLMNQEAYDLLSASGYLLDLSQDFAADARLSENSVVLETNQLEVTLGEADTLEIESVTEKNALKLSASPLFADFSQDEAIYVAVIQNTPRKAEALRYLSYLLEKSLS